MENLTLVQNNLTKFTSDLIESSLQLDLERMFQANKVLEFSDFPNSRDEGWKYSRLNKVKNLKLKNQIDAEQNSALVNRNKIIIKDGLVLPFENTRGIDVFQFNKMNKSDLAEIGSLSPMGSNVFNALNYKYLKDGLFIHVHKNKSTDESLHLIFESKENNVLACPRIYVLMEQGSSLNIVQEFMGEASNSLTLPVFEYIIQNNSSLKIDKIQCFSNESFLIGSDYCKQERDSRFTINTGFVSGNFVRNNVHVSVEGENSETNMNGFYFSKSKEHIDNQTTVEHKVSKCISNELYKGVAKEKSTAVFNGKVIVHKDAQQINAFQSNANILLDEQASINSKPELEIYANDVKCSHGSTTGQLDKNAVFYLRSRGLSENAAKKMLVHAFLTEVIDCFDGELSQSIIKDYMSTIHQWEF